MILLDDNEVNFALCNKCTVVVTFKKKDGTSGLKRHLRKGEKPATQKKITSFVERKSLPACATDQLRTDLVKFIARDLRPYNTVEGTGFLNVCQTLIDFGAKYGHLDIKSVMPSRKTVARRLPDIVSSTKDCVRKKLSESKYIALTSDGWTDDFRKISYNTVTAHYFDSQLKLQSCILDTSPVEEGKTADVLGKAVANVIGEFGLTMQQVTIVTDNAANMVAAFRDRCHRISCFAHCLNLVVNDMLSAGNDDFQNLLTNCKSLVRHFKHTGLQKELTKTLKQECPTRWNSTYTMLESILTQFDEIHEVLSQRKDLRFLYAIDRDQLSALVSFLEHFKTASESVCADSKPTLHLVVPIYHRLTTAVTKEEHGDIDMIRILKVKAGQSLLTKVRLDWLHDIAAFLNPAMKGLFFLPASRKKAVLEKVSQMIADVQIQNRLITGFNFVIININIYIYVLIFIVFISIYVLCTM